MKLRGRVVLVTGASSGIGWETALALTGRGAQVIAHGTDRARLAELAGRVDCDTVAGDLSEPDGVEAVAKAALDVAGRVDVLVCNAGVGWAGPFEGMSGDDAGRLVAVNLAAPIELTRLLLPQMRRRGSGHLTYVTSIAGRLGVAGEAVYAATKAGLDVFAESLRLELRGTGVTVGVFVPGVVDTPFFERRGASYGRERPKPLPADRVARALVDGVASGAAEVYAPRWLRLPVAVRALVPGAYRRLAGRYGEQVD